MADAGPSSGQDVRSASAPLHARARRSLSRLLRRVLLALFVLMATGGAVGFVGFLAHIPTDEPDLKTAADGIVVLTGGASRINDAMELLASGKGGRLLISGVYPETRLAEIARKVPEYERKFACCVDLDKSALNTLGNAIETRRWAMRREFKSLIIVTSNYHMPRAMAELAHQLPDATLIPFPVVSDKIRAEPWWTSAATTRLLLSEYLKYLLAVVRMQVDMMPRAAD
jgi:uncharacterized SAM-binding protein YcdF (DUF218 family)